MIANCKIAFNCFLSYNVCPTFSPVTRDGEPMKSAVKFLSHFPGKQIFATVNDKESGTFYHYHSSFEEALPKLVRDNKKGRGVFFCVNELDKQQDLGRKRTKRMFKTARAIWVEDDAPRENPRSEWPLKPNLIVQSSRGKFHYYWLTSTDDREEWESLMQVMVDCYGCDPQARDLARVLRIPGFLHQKKDPQLVKVRYLREDPYEFEALKLAFCPDGLTKVKKQKSSENAVEKIDTPDDLKKSIEQGHKHGPAMRLAMKLANKGCDLDTIMLALAPIPEYSEGDHLHCAQTAIEKVTKEQEEDADSANITEIKLPENIPTADDFNWPPGKFGEMCEQAYEMAHYPYRGVAIATCLGMLAPLVGRNNNVSGTGLNIYISLLMDTGMGKDMIRKIIERTYSQIDPINARKFIGPARYTGVPALWRTITDSPNRISVITEAGFINGADIGDSSGLKATILSMYGSSGADEVQSANEYSSKENSLPVIHSPNFSLIQESTPKSFIDAMLKTDGDINGELPRMWILRLNVEKPKRNRSPRKRFEKDVEKRIKELWTEALKWCENANVNGQKINHVIIPDWLDEEADRFVDLENKARLNGDDYRKVVYTRAWLKAVKICSLIDVFNGFKEVQKETYQWTIKHVIDREAGAITGVLREHDSSENDNTWLVIANAIQRILAKPSSYSLPVAMARAKVITLTSINFATKHNRIIKELNKKSSRFGIKSSTGLTVLLDQLCEQGYLKKLDNKRIRTIKGCEASRASIAYGMTEDFKLWLTNLS